MPIDEVTSQTAATQMVRRVLIGGETGSGKTTSLATLLALGSVAIFDCDEQAAKVFNRANTLHLPTDGLAVFPINPSTQRQYRETRSLLKTFQRGDRVADFIVLDSVTALQDMCLLQARKEANETDPGDISWDGAYRSSADHFDVIIEDFLAIPCKCSIAIAHYTYIKDKEGNVVRTQFALPGKKVHHLPRRFAVIMSAEAITKGGVTEYIFNTQPSKMRVARAPVDGFPATIPQDFAKVLTPYMPNLPNLPKEVKQ